MSKLIKHEDFKVNLKEKLVLKAASLLFKTMYFLSKFVHVLYAKMGWQSTQQITIHPVQCKVSLHEIFGMLVGLILRMKKMKKIGY